MTQPPASAPRTDVSRLLEVAAQLFRYTLPKCLPLSMVAMLCVEMPNLYWIASGHTLNNGWPVGSSYWVLCLIAAAMTLYFASAMMLQQRSLIGGTPVASVAALAAAARRLPLLLMTWLLAQVSLLVGFSLLVLPCVFLFVCYLMMLPVVLFERANNPYMVLVRCVLLVRPHWWRTLATVLIAALVVAVCVVAFAAIMGIMSALLTGTVFIAIAAACMVAFLAAVLVFLSALMLTLHSAAASSSA